MPLLEPLQDALLLWLPTILAAVSVLVTLRVLDWWLLKRHTALGGEKQLPRQLALLLITGIGIGIVVLTLPVDSSTRNQLLAVLGLIASGIIGLSSTTLVANAMASVMLRTTNSFRTGDFLRVAGHFGRVTERGLFHTEIQTESRDLTTLPNSYLITNPYTVVRSSGTIVSASLSLGYDVPVARVEPLLLEAATKAGLEEPFVRVMELGNYAITYQVSGFLSAIKHLLTSHSELCKAVIATLHAADIEIVSPSFMNQRPLPDGLRIIPEQILAAPSPASQPPPEDLMFDKAEEAEQAEFARVSLETKMQALEKQAEAAAGPARKQIQQQITELKKQLAEFDIVQAAPEPDALP